ncbi:ADP-ribose pyrophosphatase [Halobacteriales archaeon QS_8_69_26]|nr:MAG: ADP-ribose pyrophosphatase [Halobacteriales archaeon QS_8_69_26]
MDVTDEHIPEERFAECLAVLPQACVEVVLEHDGGVLLARRTNEPAEGEWFWPGGRLYRGERLPDAARRVAREELGIAVGLLGQLGAYGHFWDTASVDGLDSRHTVNVVYHCRPADEDFEIDLDDQHDDYRFVTGVEDWMHEYVREYVEDSGILGG